MRSDQLLRGLLPMQEIKRITERASDASSDTIFVCVRGARADGHDFASEAYERGCRIFVAERALELPSDARILTVPSTRQALAHLACTVYKNPSREMRVIGITGTKGKTTTAQLLRRILTESGIACGYIGTNGVLFGNVERELTNTTPDAMTLQRTLREMQEQGMQCLRFPRKPFCNTAQMGSALIPSSLPICIPITSAPWSIPIWSITSPQSVGSLPNFPQSICYTVWILRTPRRWYAARRFPIA